MPEIHPFYLAHRDAMEGAMRQRLDLAETMLREIPQVSDIDKIKQEVMDEFEIVLTQMPYVGGSASRMTDFSCVYWGSSQSGAYSIGIA